MTKATPYTSVPPLQEAEASWITQPVHCGRGDHRLGFQFCADSRRCGHLGDGRMKPGQTRYVGSVRFSFCFFALLYSHETLWRLEHGRVENFGILVRRTRYLTIYVLALSRRFTVVILKLLAWFRSGMIIFSLILGHQQSE